MADKVVSRSKRLGSVVKCLVLMVVGIFCGWVLQRQDHAITEYFPHLLGPSYAPGRLHIARVPFWPYIFSMLAFALIAFVWIVPRSWRWVERVCFVSMTAVSVLMTFTLLGHLQTLTPLRGILWDTEVDRDRLSAFIDAQFPLHVFTEEQEKKLGRHVRNGSNSVENGNCLAPIDGGN